MARCVFQARMPPVIWMSLVVLTMYLAPTVCKSSQLGSRTYPIFEIPADRPGLKPRTTCSKTQKLRYYTAAPQCPLWQTRGPLSLNCEPDYNVPQLGMEYMLIMIHLKNTNLVEDVKYSPLVKFRLIPFGGWKEEVKYVSANQRPGQPCSFSNQQEKRTCWKTFSTWFLSSFIELCSAIAEER